MALAGEVVAEEGSGGKEPDIRHAPRTPWSIGSSTPPPMYCGSTVEKADCVDRRQGVAEPAVFAPVDLEARGVGIEGVPGARAASLGKGVLRVGEIEVRQHPPPGRASRKLEGSPQNAPVILDGFRVGVLELLRLFVRRIFR